jgi:hypothetical protein
VVASAALVTVWGIGSYGIWDPWELASSRATELSFALFGVSEATALKYYRELGLPIRKGSKNGDSGIWLGSKKKIDEWTESIGSAA